MIRNISKCRLRTITGEVQGIYFIIDMGRRKQPGKFRFKRFECSHNRSSMRIGVDGVLVGLWTDAGDAEDALHILDAGCGCGVIALILSQRYEAAKVVGIDIDETGVAEACENFRNSPWGERLEGEVSDFMEYCDRHVGEFDSIVSNPPYFNDGMDMETNRNDRRVNARHQGRLSPRVLLEGGERLLKEGGRVSMILPVKEMDGVLEYAPQVGMSLIRRCYVRGHRGSEIKRVLLEFMYREEEERVEDTELVLEERPGEPTEEYKSLGHDFYLAF